MARVQLLIDDPADRMTLRAILEADGCEIVETEPQAVIADDAFKAIECAKRAPALLLARGTEIREAVSAMRQGVYGYIFVPFQPGEAALMVHRALSERLPDAASEMIALEEIESRHILAVLRQCKNNQGKAARVLGIGRNTLWRKLKRINPPKEP